MDSERLGDGQPTEIDNPTVTSVEEADKERKDEDSDKVTETSSIPNPPTPKSEHSNSAKITVVLCPVGGAPILKQRKWEVDNSQTVLFISSFIRKKLNLQKSDNLFIYVNQYFAPPLDQSVQNLFDCFGSDGKLVLAYCRTQAWG